MKKRRPRRSRQILLAPLSQRLQHQQLAVAFGQIIVERIKDIGRQAFVLGPLIDQLFAPGERGIDECAHQLNQIRALLDDVGAADRFDLAFLTVSHRDTEPIAGDDPSTLIGDLKGDARRIET